MIFRGILTNLIGKLLIVDKKLSVPYFYDDEEQPGKKLPTLAFWQVSALNLY